MKKNYFYHPLVKGLCLILCLLSIMAFAFCGLRVLFLESFGIMSESTEFYIFDHYRLQYKENLNLYWPYHSDWSYNDFYLDDTTESWYSDDPVWRFVRYQLKSDAFSEYLRDEPAWSIDDAAEQTANEEVSQESDTDTDVLSEQETAAESVAEKEAEVERQREDLIGQQKATEKLFPAIVTEDNRIYPEVCGSEAYEFLREYHSERTNFRFRVLLDGKVIFSNDAAWNEQLIHGGSFTRAVTGDLVSSAHTVTLEYGLLVDMRVQDDYKMYYTAWQNDASAWEGWLIAAGISAVTALLFLILVLLQTGKQVCTPDIRLNVIDRLPMEPVLFVKVMLGIFAVAGVAAMEWYFPVAMLMMFGYLDGNLLDWLIPLAMTVLFAITVYLGLSILRGMVRRFRAGKWWRNTLVYRMLRPIGRIMRQLWRMGRTVADHLPLAAKWLAGCAIFGLWTLLVIAANDLVFIWFFTALAAGLFLCAYMLEFDVIRHTAKKIAAGDINAHVDTARLHGTPKQIGDSLNHIGDAISVAVEDRMKSERFRTELITNVSHDLKTPLTSIINYTDLLSKEEFENDTAKEYVDVLSRQAVRLKKLTEDLLEASKASSGSLSVSLQPTDAVELLTQAVGEYEERFAARGLHVVLDIRHNPLWISADGKHLWRVFDNLLGNICKYSMSGTRVYLSAEVVGNAVVMTFRNISENPISVTASELTERFVRGDASRHTEGSGLGLAIADSLCKLQGGTLSLTVDGDLFKAVVTFAAVDSPKDI